MKKKVIQSLCTFVLTKSYSKVFEEGSEKERPLGSGFERERYTNFSVNLF